MLYLFANSLNDFCGVKEVLNKENVKYFTYTPKQVKAKNFIIKNLDNSLEQAEVLDELSSLFPSIKFTKVKLFLTRFANKSNKNLNMWLVQTTFDSITDEFTKCTRLLNQIIKIEPLKKSGSIQCFKCQRFDHAASNCGMEPRCVRCAGPHLSTECGQIVDLMGPVNVKCSNCNGQHTANYRGCPKLKEIIDRRNNHANKQTPKQRANYFPINAGKRLEGISYANISKNHASQPNPRQQSVPNLQSHAIPSDSSAFSTPHSPFNFFNSECQSLFGKSFFQTIDKFNNFIPSYSKVSNTSDKKLLLLNFLFDLCSNP